MKGSLQMRPATEVLAILEHANSKRVKLWVENEELRYKGPKGALSREDLAQIEQHRAQIIAFIGWPDDARRNGIPLAPRREVGLVQLTFSQLTRWSFIQKSGRPSIRQIASATRLRGSLNEPLLRESFAKLVDRHEALRTRFSIVDGIPMQEVGQSGNCKFESDDLTHLGDEQREERVVSLVDQLILEPIDVTAGPLTGAKLVKLRSDENVLIIAMEHIISDAASMSILLRDWFALYDAAVQGKHAVLPELPVQLIDYASWQRETIPLWLHNHAGYWTSHLQGAERLRFPEDGGPTVALKGWRGAPIIIGPELKSQLQEWSRLRGTTLAMSMLTVFVALVLRWCAAEEGTIEYQMDGRSHPALENAIGYFAAPLHLRLTPAEHDTLTDLLKQVTQEYCNAYLHADFSYLNAQVPSPECVLNSGFNWVPIGPTNSASTPANLWAGKLHASALRFENPSFGFADFDAEPSVLFYEGRDEIAGAVYYPANRFHPDTMKRFARNFLLFINAMLSDPELRIEDLRLQ